MRTNAQERGFTLSEFGFFIFLFFLFLFFYFFIYLELCPLVKTNLIKYKKM